MFSRTTIFPGEDPEEFEELYSDLIKEWAPSGATEEDAVLSIAKAIWRKRRAQKFIHIQVLNNSLNPRHRSYDEFTSLSGFADILRTNPDVDFEDYAGRVVEADTVKKLTRKFPRSRFKSNRAWADAVIEEIESVLIPKVDFRGHPAAEYGQLMLSSATFTDDYFDKELRLDERLDIMIDRAVKRLVQTKAMKQMFGQTGAEQTEDRVRKIAAKQISRVRKD